MIINFLSLNIYNFLNFFLLKIKNKTEFLIQICGVLQRSYKLFFYHVLVIEHVYGGINLSKYLYILATSLLTPL